VLRAVAGGSGHKHNMDPGRPILGLGAGVPPPISLRPLFLAVRGTRLLSEGRGTYLQGTQKQLVAEGGKLLSGS